MALAQPTSALACAACYGQSDSAMAKGFNWGIFSLLAVIVTVLATIAGFFVFLARRSAAFSTGVTLPASANSPLNSQHPPLTAH
jgi:ascorbate-specific PTS system EIIC-type component UlaA